MKNIRLVLLLLLLTLLTSNIFAKEYKALVGATLIKTDGKGIIENAIVLLEDNKIKAVGKEIKGKIPDGAEIIDLTGKYLIPGLVDGHIHFFQSGGLYTRPDGLDLRHRVPYEQEQQWINDNLDDFFRRYLRCGITSVVDMGGPFWNFDVRDKARNAVIAPRTYVAGPLISSYQPDAFKIDDAPIVKVNNKAEALDLVRKQVKLGADLIKIWYIVGNRAGGEDFFPIARAVCQESHKNGLPVYVHATELETAKKAMKAGCDVLVHNVVDKPVDEEFLKLAKKNDVIVIPTLWVFNSYAAVYSKQLKLLKVEHLLGNPDVIGTLFDMHELDYDELGERQRKLQIEKKPIEAKKVVLDNLKKIHDYGITVAAGTDAGNVGVIHGPSLFHEFLLMKQAGLTNHEILVDATLNGAKLTGHEKENGSITPGKYADIVVLNSDPLENILNTADIHLTIKDGKIFRPEDLVTYSPRDLAQIQLNAYNARDIESFLAVYSPNVEVYEFPDKLVYKGRDKMRERYTPFFLKANELHCKLVDRITIGNFVMDREKVKTGIPERDNLEAVAVYEAIGGLIRKVWFMK